MSQETEPTGPKRRNPDIWRHAMWHSESGLVVSPYNRTLPAKVTVDSESKRIRDYKTPRILSDNNVYLAYYPIQPIDRGELFSVLSLSFEELKDNIHNVAYHGTSRYVLSPSLIRDWKALEDALLSVVNTLLSEHRYSNGMPGLVFPRLPRDCGYDQAHVEYGTVINCAKSSILAFSTLVALTSFALSLWLASYEENSFDRAFETLATRKVDPLPRSWLQYLRESPVCYFAPGARPGGYLNPFVTGWVGAFKYFTRAHVPFWLIWGHVWEVSPSEVRYRANLEFFPPKKYIQMAQRRPLSFSHIILPFRETHNPNAPIPSPPLIDYNLSSPYRAPARNSPAHPPMYEGAPEELGGLNTFVDSDQVPPFVTIKDLNRDEPPAPPPPVDRRSLVEQGSNQRVGESWGEFFARYSATAERRKAAEDPRQKTQRESRQQAARKGPTKTSILFVWEQDDIDKTFYRRTRITKHYVRAEWKDATQYQRFYWAHVNEWDIVRHIPAWPAGCPRIRDTADSDSDDDDFRATLHNGDTEVDVSVPGRTNLPQTGPVREKLLSVVAVMAGQENEPETEVFRYLSVSVVTYLRIRHGFVVDQGQPWNPRFHVDKFALQDGELGKALKNLCYLPEAGISTGMATSIVDFHNIARKGPPYLSLPSNWDISRLSQGFYCDPSKFRVQRVPSALGTCPLYIIRPPPRSSDVSTWFVATTSATAVLMAYRSSCNTMYELARFFLNYGIRFNTVVERGKREGPRPRKPKMIGLGARPVDFVPSAYEYGAYKQIADNVLRSADGRALFLLGGIVGRLAAEVVPDYKVLDGPNLVNECVVGYSNEYEYVDDAINPNLVDIVCGVYRVDRNNRHSTLHCSWWPRPSHFDGSAYASDHWAPAAEAWYKDRLSNFSAGRYDLKPAGTWRSSLKLNNMHVEAVIKGSEHMAVTFLTKSSRAREARI